MSDKSELESSGGRAYKCGGIPMYPEEYHFDMERPEGISDEDIEISKKQVGNFLEKYGIIVHDDYFS